MGSALEISIDGVRKVASKGLPPGASSNSSLSAIAITFVPSENFSRRWPGAASAHPSGEAKVHPDHSTTPPFPCGAFLIMCHPGRAPAFCAVGKSSQSAPSPLGSEGKGSSPGSVAKESKFSLK